jgi:hypothetical protein
MIQRLERCDPPRRIQGCHPAYKVTELCIDEVPLPERLSGVCRIEAPRESNKTFEEWVLLTDLL